ncbi:putative histone deacetylase [Helianthus annuus]|uniref:histone deacetylase n=1 Tax=Helianthus annuus TaxID=4232 RepID=A0A9K3JRH3_HELAN|nr:putative histone deacetylase [Helianthus annuus]KAJ0605807.1 putative histone deacetylase [Helianthus annuus]KAJ0619806.1 putative histone deacetylase [Helianthus annuus]KAJ0778265.1 putative histone deacetylase [Helianthus annuus]KAJ0787246.1 putative histone deacetylase [Helianthus annuus]
MGFCLHKKDVHHGNGTQEIYKQNKTVLYVSLHRHEGGKFYPGTGAVHEFGSMVGEGYYVNIPWSRGGVRDNDYIFAFEHIVLPIAREFAHDFTIISAGFDAARGDPLGCCDCLRIVLTDHLSEKPSIGETVVHPLLTSLMQSAQATNNHKRFSHSEVPLW